MIHVEPFQPAHVCEIALSEAGRHDMDWHDRRRLHSQFGEAYRGFTFRDGETGRVLFCGGAIERHPQYASLWGLYAEDVTIRQWAWILVRHRRFVEDLPHRRVDAMIEASLPQSRRWAKALGLREEAALIDAAPDGGAMLIYRRIEE